MNEIIYSQSAMIQEARRRLEILKHRAILKIPEAYFNSLETCDPDKRPTEQEVQSVINLVMEIPFYQSPIEENHQ